MTLEEKKQEIIEDFSLYDEWLDKYEYLIELGKSLDAFPEEKKTEDRLIKGCLPNNASAPSQSRMT